MSMVHEHITWEHSERTRPSKRTLIEKYRWVMRPLCRDSGYPAVWNFGLDPYRLFDGLSRLLLRLEVRVEEILVLEDPVRFYGSQLSRTRFVRIKWCAWWDSNPHALRQRNLNPSCIPISPQAHAEITSEAFPCARRRPWSSARRPALPGTCHRKPASEIPQGPPSACGLG